MTDKMLLCLNVFFLLLDFPFYIYYGTLVSQKSDRSVICFHMVIEAECLISVEQLTSDSKQLNTVTGGLVIQSEISQASRILMGIGFTVSLD